MEQSVRLEIKSWDEKPTVERPTGEKLARAVVSLAGADAFAGEVTSDSVLYYRADGTSDFLGVYWFDGTLDGREGTFAVRTTGTFDGTTAVVDGTVVPGSGTGALVGISGGFTSSSTHGDYPYMPVTLVYQV